MVHQMMNSNIQRAAKASRKSKNMLPSLSVWRSVLALSLVTLVVACGTPPKSEPPVDDAEPVDVGVAPDPQVQAAWESMLAWDQGQALPSDVMRSKARWRAVHWSSLPGVAQDELQQVMPALLRNCGRAPQALAPWCEPIRLWGMQAPSERVEWLVREWQPYAIESPSGARRGLLTGYFEPQLVASRVRTERHQVPLHALPRGWRARGTWFSRQEMDTLPAAQEALRGRELVWVEDPIDALILQIQGSGRVNVSEPDGTVRTIRLAFAGHNGQTYGSVGRWLLDRGEVSNAHWSDIRAWARANPHRLQEMLWANPRVVFFQEEPLSDMDATAGPRGAQGVPLTPGRSIAVDRFSIPYGTPVWMTTPGPTLATRRWVVAQDTGGAILGAVRADFFMGWGDEARDVASSLKQPLKLWALWPRGLTPPN